MPGCVLEGVQAAVSDQMTSSIPHDMYVDETLICVLRHRSLKLTSISAMPSYRSRVTIWVE